MQPSGRWPPPPQLREGDFSARISVSSEDEIGQLASALNNMATSLSSSENMRRNFIANVSHELKTPMTHLIAGFIDGILDGTIPKEQEPKYLSIVSQEVKRLHGWYGPCWTFRGLTVGN